MSAKGGWVWSARAEERQREQERGADHDVMYLVRKRKLNLLLGLIVVVG